MNVMRLTALVLLATALGFSVLSAEAADPKTVSGRTVLSVAQRHPAAAAKTAKKPAVRKSTRVYRSARLVPPPPAYMPSILPELYYRQHHQQVEAPAVADAALTEETAEPPLKKYFYSATDEDVTPVQQRSGVSTWSTRQVSPVSYSRAN